ncbi:MAG: transporter substrate-binding domain-containing protein [Gemmataceae bacterium]
MRDRSRQGRLVLGMALLGLAAVVVQDARRATGAIARIRRTGVLRVGTTGDYDPFSVVDACGRYRGIDVEAAHRLAATVGPGCGCGSCELPGRPDRRSARPAASTSPWAGSAATGKRAEAGLLSRPYLTDAKVALIRAADRHRFRTLADIDRPGMTVLVNPGGTNQQFVAAHVRQARVNVVPDNLAIPGKVAAGAGDVMFTDGIEARLYAHRDRRLAVALADSTLMTVEKVALLCRRHDVDLLPVVDAAISAMQADGTYARLRAKYVGD